MYVGRANDNNDEADDVLKSVFAGVFSGGVTPDPIPNSAVKPACGDGIAPATVWESSTTPALFCKGIFERRSFFFAQTEILRTSKRARIKANLPFLRRFADRADQGRRRRLHRRRCRF